MDLRACNIHARIHGCRRLTELLPQQHGTIVAAGGEALTVVGNSKCSDCVLVRLRAPQQLRVAPELHLACSITGDEQARAQRGEGA